MRILIVRNEQHAAKLTMTLAEAGLTIDHARDTGGALSLALGNHYDLMIADEMSGGVDGEVLVRHLRSIGNGTPALLYADSELTLNRMLAAGADDVLLKSATPAELLERVHALLRTFASRARATSTRLWVADLELDRVLHTSFRARRPLDLTRCEFSTLELLMQRHGEVVSRTLIASTGLPSSKRSPEAVDVHMRRLRRKVDGNTPRKLLHIVREAGFVLEDRFRHPR